MNESRLPSITDNITQVLYSCNEGSIPSGASNNCLACGQLTDNPKFCSLSCSAKEQMRIKYLDYNPTRKCISCNNDFSIRGERSQKRFCTRSCAAIVNNKKFPKRGKGKKGCSNCNRVLTNSQKTFCGQTCQQGYYNGIRIYLWLTGQTSGLSKNGTVTIWVKRWLIENRGNKCELCGWSRINPHTNKVPLTADHIDGNYLNNKPENLRLLCACCDSLQATYKAANKGNGRPHRRVSI